jgi:hypothetical protein
VTALLVISALLLIASGGIKLRVGARTGLGVPPLSLVELLAGVGIAASALTGDPTVESGFRLVLGGVALVLVSSVHMGMKFAARRRERDDSEGLRLFKYVKYLSPQTPKDDLPPTALNLIS